MNTAEIIEIINTLPENRKAEVADFIKFLRYQIAKERLLASDREGRLTFQSVDELIDAIDNRKTNSRPI